MRRIIHALSALLLLTAPAAAQKTKAQLQTEINTNLPDNTTGLITPSIMRTTHSDEVNSWQQAPRVNPQNGTTYTFDVTDYGQLVTFTNSSPVAVALPQATGTFATWNTHACNYGAGAVTITPTVSTIGGASSLVLQQNQCRFIVSDGANYKLADGVTQPVTCAASNWINAITSNFVPTCSQPAFTDISGTLAANKGGTGSSSVPAAGQIPIGNAGGTAYAPVTISGDASVTSAGVWTNAKINGVAYPSGPSGLTVPVVTSPNTITYEAVPNAALANPSITLNAGANVALTVPGTVALGATATIGATSDTPRFAGMGFGCTASGAFLLTLCGSSSGKVDLKVPAVAGNNTITFPAGTTDFSGTGGASQVVKQTTLGGAFTVAQLAASDLSNGTTGSGAVALAVSPTFTGTLSFGTLDPTSLGLSTTTVTGLTVNNTPVGNNDYFLYYSAADNRIRKCTLSACTSSGVSGVSSLNGLTGSLSVSAGTGMNVSAGGSAVTVSLSQDNTYGFRNFLINPSGEVMQVPMSSTATTNNNYDFDQWITLTQTGAVALGQFTPSSSFDGGYGMEQAQSQVAAQRFGHIQWIESVNAVALRSKTVVFSIRARWSSANNVRMAILEWTGTADGMTASSVRDPVNSWTNSTYTTGNFFKNTAGLVVDAVSPSLSAGASNTTATLTLSGSIGATANNVAVMIWTESAEAQNVTMDTAKAQLEFGSIPTSLAFRDYGRELALCSRYFRRVPQGNVVTFANGQAFSTSQAVIPFHFIVPMRVAPTLTLSNVSHFAVTDAGAAAKTTTALTLDQGTTETARLVATVSGTPLVAGNATNLFSQNASATFDLDARM